MRKLLFCTVLMTASAFGQGVRFDSSVTTVASNVPVGSSAAIFTVPNAIVTICNIPASGAPCTNTVPIYSDLQLTQPINNPLSADAQGRYGFYVLPGIYSETVQKQSGSVVGTYILSLNTIGINASPDAAQTVMQPGTTTLSVNSLNGALNAALFPGSDIGAQVNNAILSFANNCGDVYIPAGTYSQTTTINKPRCVKLHGAGSYATTLTYTPTTGTAVIAGDTIGGPNGYPTGEMSDLTLQGPSFTGATIGIFLGAPSSCVSSCLSGDHQNFNRVRIVNFGTAVTFGNNAFMDTFLEDVITNDGVGISFPVGLTDSGESIDFIRTSIQNNTKGLSLLGFSDFYFYASTCDFNGTCGTVCQASFYGFHIEQPSGNLLNIDGTCQAGPAVFIYGGLFAHDSTIGTDAQMITVSGSVSPTLKIDGVEIIESHTLTDLVNWTATGSNPKLVLQDFPFFNGNVLALTNANCNFLGCKFQDNQGDYAYTASNSSVNNAGAAVYSSVQTTGGPGLATTLGFATLKSNGTGTRFDSNSGAGNTPIFLTNTLFNGALTDFEPRSVLPVPASTAPSGACVNPGQLEVTADGHGTYCKVGTLIWTTLY